MPVVSEEDGHKEGEEDEDIVTTTARQWADAPPASFLVLLCRFVQGLATGEEGVGGGVIRVS